MKKIALTLMLLATPASAKNGEFLYAMCQSADSSELGAGYCLGAIDSIFRVMEGGNSINGMSACFPTDFGTKDAIGTVIQYLEESGNAAELNLQQLNIPSAVALIFWTEFVCD